MPSRAATRSNSRCRPCAARREMSPAPRSSQTASAARSRAVARGRGTAAGSSRELERKKDGQDRSQGGPATRRASRHEPMRRSLWARAYTKRRFQGATRWHYLCPARKLRRQPAAIAQGWRLLAVLQRGTTIARSMAKPGRLRLPAESRMPRALKRRRAHHSPPNYCKMPRPGTARPTESGLPAALACGSKQNAKSRAPV